MCSRKHTIERIKASKVAPKTLCEGADVSDKWLRDLVSGANENPTTRTLKKVNEFLDKHLEEQIALKG